MIEVRELRIGNLVSHKGNPIELTKNRFKLSVFTLGCSEIEPILLTEEWLVRFGFVFEKSGWFVKKRGSKKTNNLKMFHLFKMKNINEYNTKGGITSKYLNIKQVHQLQNLYFALTGEELQLKEI